MYTYETREVDGMGVRIVYDQDPESPRQWDNLGTMICWHRRYNLGDEHRHTDPTAFKRQLAIDADRTVESRIDYWENREGYLRLRPNYKACDEIVEKLIDKVLDKYYIIVPLYLYDHSGITMSTGPFSCPWDSGRVGYIYISIKDVKKTWSWQHMTKSKVQNVIQHLVSEVKIYDDYLRGDVFGFEILDEDGDAIDTCYGYYGTDFENNGLLAEVRSSIAYDKERTAHEKGRNHAANDLVTSAAL